MITFTCDNCGYELKLKGIVQNHYAFIDGGKKLMGGRKFEQLIPQLCTKEVTDVCEKCFKVIEHKRFETAKGTNEGIFKTVREFINKGFKHD